MSVSIQEAIWNANYNIQNNGNMGLLIAKGQLNNASVLLEKGYPIHTQVEPLLEEFGSVEAVPDFVE